MNVCKPVYFLFSTVILFFLIGCNSPENQDGITVFENALVWNGLPDHDFEPASVIVKDGAIQQVLYGNNLDVPQAEDIINLEGKYLMPGLINAHGHVGMAHGLRMGPPEGRQASIDNVISQLKLYAKYGITTVVSLGDEPDEAFHVRDAMQPEDKPMARMFLAGQVLHANTPDEAAAITKNHLAKKPDWLKIRVDDGLGTREKLAEEVYSQIIATGLENSVPLAAHIVTLEDAKSVIRHKAEIIGHSVRDAAVDTEFIELMLDDDLCITPTLTRELSTFVYADEPDFFEDPFFLAYADLAVVEQLKLPEVQRRYTGPIADYFRNALPLAQANLNTLHNAGIKIAMGTDSGPPARFQGYFEHLELALMQDAGMPVKDILVSSTSLAAECMNLNSLTGTIETGKKADFLILEDNPMESLMNLRNIWGVYIGGVPVAR